MEVVEALRRIEAIHEHMTRGEEYRGVRRALVAAAGVLGLLAAGVQPWLVALDDPRGFVVYWLVVAGVCGLVAGGSALYAHGFSEDEYARRRSRQLMGQFFPCLLAGAVV